jgi:hypothetical protein
MADVQFDMPVPPALPGRKSKTSVYVVLLAISLVALLVGCLFLYLEIKRFGGFGAVTGRVAQAASRADSHFMSRPLSNRLRLTGCFNIASETGAVPFCSADCAKLGQSPSVLEHPLS